MARQDLKERTKQFALRIIKLYTTLEKTKSYPEIIGKQLLRSGTSIGANYRAARIAKSDKDFVNKLKICEEEADESVYWLELLIDSKAIHVARLQPLLEEAKQLTAILTASIKTHKNNQSPH